MAKSWKSHLVFPKTRLPIVTMNDYRHFTPGPYSRGEIVQLLLLHHIQHVTAVDIYYYLAPGGGCEVLFSPCLSVCLCVCVCPANILVFYLSAIRRDIDLKFIQDTYRVVLNSQKNIDFHGSKVKVTGTVHWFLKVQLYHKNWAIEKFHFFS